MHNLRDKIFVTHENFRHIFPIFSVRQDSHTVVYRKLMEYAYYYSYVEHFKTSTMWVTF